MLFLSTARAAVMALAALTVVVTLISARPTLAAVAQEPSAILDGERVRLSTAVQYHCHDLAYSQLRCFTTVEGRDDDVAIADSDGDGIMATSSGYVIAWSSPSYTGSSVVLSQSYANLGTIGWNDRISSYKVYTSLTGAFYEHTNYQGLTQQYCCLAQVSYVGSLYNNKFSSFYLP
jgi:hypothetical protein